MTPGDESQSTRSQPAQFAATHWSTVLAARGDSTHAREALEKLCRTYWYPLYAFVRRRGYSAADAQDLTQEFFARLLAKQSLRSVDPAKGRFRSFLLASLNHFLANEWDRARAQKRGGGQILVPLDPEAAESRYASEPAHTETPEKLFERQWALTLLEQVLGLLRQEFTAKGKGNLFDHIKGTLTGQSGTMPYAELASQLGMTEAAVKVAVHRLRGRYRELLRAEVAHTVASPEGVEEELRNLRAALRR